MVPDSTESSALPACLYCGGRDYQPLFSGIQDRLRHVPGTWAYHRCRQCGSAMLAPHPRVEDLPSFYPPVYSFTPEMGEQQPLVRRLVATLHHRLFLQPQYATQARKVLRGIAWHGRPGLRLLDVGCGRGLRLLALQRRGCEVQGMDFQAGDVDYVRDRLAIPAVCTDIDGLTNHFAPETFGAITSFHVIEHVADVARMLRSCWELLKPGGWLVAATPLVDSVQARWLGRRWVAVTDAPRHLSLPSQEGLRRACTAAGFSQITIRPDSTLSCAGVVATSLFPGSTTTHLYGSGRLRALLSAGAAGVTTLLAFPWCLVENYALRRPAYGMVFARKS